MQSDGIDLNPSENAPKVWREDAALRPGSRQIRLRRAAISASLLKVIASAAFAGYFIWRWTTPMDALAGLLTIGSAFLWVCGGIAYMLAAFLLSRRSFRWRFGGIIDATVTAAVAWVFFWFAEQSFAAVNAYGQGNPGELPAVIFAAIGVVWIAASIPMVAWFLLGAATRFQLRRQQA